MRFPRALRVFEYGSDENDIAQCTHYEQLVEFDFSTPPGGVPRAGRPGGCYRQYIRGIYPALESVRKCLGFSQNSFVHGDATARCCVKARAAGQTPTELADSLRAILSAYVATFITILVFCAFDLCLSVSLIVLK